MSTLGPMRLAQAERYALHIVDWLRPYCTRIEIAGSIRRRRTECNDVDIVCIPKLVPTEDLAGATGQVRNLVREELIRYVKATPLAGWRNETEPKWDASNLLVQLPKCELDLWCANEMNFATRFMCRTGSREHNIWLAERAKRWGFERWDSYRGLVTKRGLLKVAATEAELYRALDLEFIAPENREFSFLRGLDGSRLPSKNQNEKSYERAEDSGVSRE